MILYQAEFTAILSHRLYTPATWVLRPNNSWFRETEGITPLERNTGNFANNKIFKYIQLVVNKLMSGKTGRVKDEQKLSNSTSATAHPAVNKALLYLTLGNSYLKPQNNFSDVIQQIFFTRDQKTTTHRPSLVQSFFVWGKLKCFFTFLKG